MPLPAVTLTFDLLTSKSNVQIYEPKYISDQNWVKFPSLAYEISCSQGFRDAQTHRVTHRWTQLKTVCLHHWMFSVMEASKS